MRSLIALAVTTPFSLLIGYRVRELALLLPAGRGHGKNLRKGPLMCATIGALAAEILFLYVVLGLLNRLSLS